jgi:hypothetical protein
MDPREQEHFVGAWVIDYSDGDSWYASWTQTPTHWQPLPEPPPAENAQSSISRGEANSIREGKGE